jgi:hypothetical protein
MRRLKPALNLNIDQNIARKANVIGFFEKLFQVAFLF